MVSIDATTEKGSIVLRVKLARWGEIKHVEISEKHRGIVAETAGTYIDVWTRLCSDEAEPSA